MEKFQFTPENGFEDATAFPDPGSETETREQIFRLHQQTRDYINNQIYPVIGGFDNAIEEAKASAEEAKQAAKDAQSSSDSAFATTPDGYKATVDQVYQTVGDVAKVKATADGNSNKLKVKAFTVPATGWSDSASQQDGSAYYTSTVAITTVYADHPEAFLGAKGTIPTEAERDAFGLVKSVTVDAGAKTIKLYAEAKPTADFVILMRGVV